MIELGYEIAGRIKNFRSIPNVFLKLSEEVGELAQEISIKFDPNCTKKSGDDGINGETVDIIINCFDILFLNDCSEEKVIEIFKNKLAKWEGLASLNTFKMIDETLRDRK